MTRLLEVEDLSTHFVTDEGIVRAVEHVSFHVDQGETLGLVGESGCGKSVTALSLVRLVPPPGRIVSGRIVYKGADLMRLEERDIRRYRGREIALVFQEPMTALNPVFTVGYQIAEGLIVHGMMKKKEALREAARLMELVRIPDALRRLRDYPHQMSGGMRQRVLIAMALACRPSLLVADEPTTALDVTLQAEVLDLLRRLKDDLGLSLILISHNLGVIAETADRVAVMYAGRIVEEAPVRDLFATPKHPYTAGLLKSIPRLGEGGEGAGRRKRRLSAIEGNVPDLLRLPPGCAFHPRCPEVMPECRVDEPRFLGAPEGRRAVACFKHHDPGGRPR
ncbi:MAG TPA: ABC transporter ATP-binding protein [Candidatus Polarisedimenticolia bacterium]|nr:ABC transporter ATP-binding protein [Candidatus Polarisedimenticolia bacterium]